MVAGEWSYNATVRSTQAAKYAQKASGGKSEKAMGVPCGEGSPYIEGRLTVGLSRDGYSSQEHQQLQCPIKHSPNGQKWRTRGKNGLCPHNPEGEHRRPPSHMQRLFESPRLVALARDLKRGELLGA
jgi:hypothetical protein